MMRVFHLDDDWRIQPSSEVLEHALRIHLGERYQGEELDKWNRILDEVIDMRRNEGLL